MDRLQTAISGPDPSIVLRDDPNGIAPERALVFITAVPIQNFNRVAKAIGLEVFSESEDDELLLPDDLIEEGVGVARPTLYATMPSIQVFKRLLSLWKSFQNGDAAPDGSAPWWQLFELLAELRPWGPSDRLGDVARREIEYRLPMDDDVEVRLELEVWPTANEERRERWKTEAAELVAAKGGRIISSCTIGEPGFVYDALLVGLPASAVRHLLNEPTDPNGIGALDGVQHILPQTIGQSIPDGSDPNDMAFDEIEPIDQDVPYRALLLDGTPIAAHAQLEGGVNIEDVHDLDTLSLVSQRSHATSMASLILRGDLAADGKPAVDASVISIPLLIDRDKGAYTPDDRLFVDLVHVALQRAFMGDEPLAPDVFVVNFSIGIRGAGFVRSPSSLARLLDWWSETAGVLFVVSAGNIGENIWLPDCSSYDFENTDFAEQRKAICAQLSAHKAERAILAPSEAMNVLTVGAVSDDLADPLLPTPAGEIEFSGDGQIALTSGIGLGALRAIKPDIVAVGGCQNVIALSDGDDTRIMPLETGRTGLHVASSNDGTTGTKRERGTSCAAALVTRAALNCAAALTAEGGPYEGQTLARVDAALLTKCLLVNSARWPQAALDFFADVKDLGGHVSHHKEEVARFYGHGLFSEERAVEAPTNGTTLVGLGTLRKDQADVFEVPLPPSMSGQKLARSLVVTLAWFSPVEPARARYRLAALEAVAADGLDDEAENDPDWYWSMKGASTGVDHNQIRRGTIWSKRLMQKNAHTPVYGDDAVLPIRVQCRDASGGGLSPDDDIRFAIAVGLETEVETEFDIHQEVRDRLKIQVGAQG
jgi:hypothetical protein